MIRTLTLIGLLLGFNVSAYAQGSTQDFSLIERGRYLVTLSDCAGCHTAPGGEPFAGGVALQTPFGTLVAPNITSDTDTGIGNWSDDDFVANGRQDDPADDQDVPVRVDVPRTARAVRLAIEGMLAEFSRGDEVEPPKRC